MRFAWRDVEKAWIELINRAQETAVACSDPTRGVGIGIIECVGIPAVGRNRADRIDPVVHQPPKTRRIVSAAWHAAAKADDSDRLARSLLH